jgi:hypothetical protein
MMPKYAFSEAAVLYPPMPAPTPHAAPHPVPDFSRIPAESIAQTVILVSTLTGTAERVLFTHDGACVVPVEPDGRYAPFASLAAVFRHADEINAWLAEAAVHRGVPPDPPAWLASLPKAGPRLLGTIRSRIASARTAQITLQDLEGRTATIVVPPRSTLALPEDNAREITDVRLAARRQFVVALDQTGEPVHVLLDPNRTSVPERGEVLHVERSTLRRERRLRAAHVKIRNSDDPHDQ